MQDINYFKLFKQALSLTWKNKFIWWLGFFMLLGSFSLNSNFEKEPTQQSLALQEKAFNFLQTHLFLTISLAIILFCLLLFLFLLRIAAKAALIKALTNLEFYAKQSLKLNLKNGLEHLSGLFYLELLLGLTAIFLFLVLTVPVAFLFSFKATFFAFFATFLALLIFLPTMIAIYFIHTYAYFYKVLGNLPLFAAIENAYYLFKNNLKKSLSMLFFFFLFNLLFMSALLLSIILIALLALVLGAIPILFLPKVVLITLAVLCALLLFVILVVVLSFWEACKQTAWFLFFQQIAPLIKKNNEETILLENKEIIEEAKALG